MSTGLGLILVAVGLFAYFQAMFWMFDKYGSEKWPWQK